MKLENTQDWSLERLVPYGPQITAAMKKVIDKFPEDATLDSMAKDMFAGFVQLWLMLDGDTFKGFVLTDLKTVDATGYKAVRVIALGGEDGVDLCPHIEEIEKWAWAEGANSVLAVGRQGWKKPLSKLGYEVERIVYRKDKPE